MHQKVAGIVVPNFGGNLLTSILVLMGSGEAEGMVEPHPAVPRRPGHGGLGVVVEAEMDARNSDVNDENCTRESRCGP